MPNNVLNMMKARNEGDLQCGIKEISFAQKLQSSSHKIKKGV